MRIIENNQTIGLTSGEVKARVQRGQVNKTKKDTTNTYPKILFTNIFSFFNLINCVLFFLVCLTGSYQNGLFVFVVFSNVIINLFQEVRSKRTLDKLALLKVAKADVYRDGKLENLPIHKLVMDDVLRLKSGDQVPTDAKVIQGSLEVNESLLTGEMDTIYKQPADELFSGSFITAGEALCQVIHVGADNYIAKINKEAKTIKRQKYLIQGSLNKIIRWISLILVPLCTLLFVKQFYFSHATFNTAILRTVAAAVGMFPEGLFLLTSVTLTISAVYLARKKVMVQELNCIDALARVDVLCLDKTGTITEGKMTVEKTISFHSETPLAEITGNLMAQLPDQNPTAMALRTFLPEKKTYQMQQVVPFSSDRKFSCVTFEGQGTYFIGAASILLGTNHEAVLKQERQLAEEGYRVIVLAHSTQVYEEAGLPTDIEPLGFYLLSDTIREDAKETLEYFRSQAIQCKIISGDDPVTVSQIAKKVNLPGAADFIDVSKLTATELKEAVSNYQIFGRVTPQQKKEMVLYLKEQGHTVAMTGDGVNDVLALKEADCSIAMASGVDAARQVSNLVLLENQFDALPSVMDEGRRVINNITRSGSLVLVQVLFSIMITMGTLLSGTTYPFEPIQLTIINACFVGIPTFFLNFEPDFNRIKGDFMTTIFKNAFPTALTITVGTLLIINFGYWFNSSSKALSIMSIIFTAWNYRLIQKKVYPAINSYRTMIFFSTQILYFAALIVGRDLFNLGNTSYLNLILLIALLNFSAYMQRFADKGIELLMRRYTKKRKSLSKEMIQ
ncbi:HAD-IC family P-type ATPase [Enterococcus casseliflavus]|uniref:HAD-IC family P-type ATPase n=1 Tax=Enterococcus casseliflavus TaxID=37734 RepID=UPI002DBBEB16|nr:HAD-IC family P-type ATPase [Enterococcus casseliflavus]MEB8398861.1 HAD-IC family P-type ATPase [Enterococcus casseliflavus]